MRKEKGTSEHNKKRRTTDIHSLTKFLTTQEKANTFIKGPAVPICNFLPPKFQHGGRAWTRNKIVRPRNPWTSILEATPPCHHQWVGRLRCTLIPYENMHRRQRAEMCSHFFSLLQRGFGDDLKGPQAKLGVRPPLKEGKFMKKYLAQARILLNCLLGPL